MLLINCEINLILTLFAKCILISVVTDNEVSTLAITDTKLFVLVVRLSTQENVKLLDQLYSGFKRTIDWNKYQSKVSIQVRN